MVSPAGVACWNVSMRTAGGEGACYFTWGLVRREGEGARVTAALPEECCGHWRKSVGALHFGNSSMWRGWLHGAVVWVFFLLHVCYFTQVYPVGMYAQLHSLLVHDTQAGRQCSSGRLGTRLVVACPQQCVCGSGCFVTCTAVVCEHLSSPVSAAFWACIHATACMHVRMCV